MVNERTARFIIKFVQKKSMNSSLNNLSSPWFTFYSSSLCFSKFYMFSISLVFISILRSTINAILLKISFMDIIDFHSVFKGISVISSVPNCLNNTETFIICYK